MKKSDLKKKLSEVRKNREYGQYAESVTILHQVTNEHPEPEYFYLLAATYMEAGENDPAIQYADEALAVDINYKEAYELKAKIYESQNKFKDAEQMYLKALKIDPDFFEARNGLVVSIYWKAYKDYKKVVEQCDFIFNQYDTFTFKEKEVPSKYRWLGAFEAPGLQSYVFQKKYKEAIRLILRYKYVIKYYIGKGDDAYTLAKEDRILYKLYYILDDKEKLEEMKKYMVEYYRTDDNTFKGMEKDVEQGYIYNMNKDNYVISPKG